MERTIFLQHYRVCLSSDGTPNELCRDGAAIAYEAVDERSGEPVALTLLPVESIDPAVREQFEEQARAVERLRHVNIAKVFDFGREGGNYVYVSEKLPGETLAAWVAQHGPMPADAVLRVAEQIVSVLSTAKFHKLAHCAIQPSNLMIVPGPTPEGSWPFVKLLNFGLAELKSSSESIRETDSARGELDELNGSDGREESSSVASHFASPEQLKNGTTDFRSEVYSLGATMYFLLTTAAPSAELRRGELQVFPKPLRALLSQMLRRNPDQRPKDPVALAEMIRQCLLKIERRQRLARRFGIPLISKIPRTTKRRPERLRRIALAASALIIAAAVIAVLLFSQDIGRILGHHHGPKPIGVLVGVRESSPTPAIQSPSSPVTPDTVLSPQAATLAFGQQSQPNTSTAASSAPAASPNVEPRTPSGQTSNAQLEAAANPANSPGETATAPATTVENLAQTNATPRPANTNQTSSQSKKKRVASSQGRTGSTRPQMIGITSDGRMIYRLPSGRTKVVAPDSDEDELVPRRHRRAFIERDETFVPTQRFEPDYSPYD